jgi:hypothetical protein
MGRLFCVLRSPPRPEGRDPLVDGEDRRLRSNRSEERLSAIDQAPAAPPVLTPEC